MSWTDTRVEELKQLWDAGVGTAEIGVKLGMTKNAIIGKAHRIGLKPRRRSSKRKGLRLVGVNGRTCQWPFGDPGTPEFHFCGAEALEGKSYCGEHYARAYISVQIDKADAA